VSEALVFRQHMMTMSMPQADRHGCQSAARDLHCLACCCHQMHQNMMLFWLVVQKGLEQLEAAKNCNIDMSNLRAESSTGLIPQHAASFRM